MQTSKVIQNTLNITTKRGKTKWLDITYFASNGCIDTETGRTQDRNSRLWKKLGKKRVGQNDSTTL